ncbi:MAG: aminopeptidase N, partial [Planctomycetota bacterium]
MGVQKLHYLGAALAAFAVYLAPQDLDPRESYDVKAYHLDLRVDPAERSLAGSVTMDAIVLRGPLDEVVLDLTA